MTTALRSWEEKEREGECKNQIRRRRHHRDEGGREDLTISMQRRDDAHAHSAAHVYMVLLDI